MSISAWNCTVHLEGEEHNRVMFQAEWPRSETQYGLHHGKERKGMSPSALSTYWRSGLWASQGWRCLWHLK